MSQKVTKEVGDDKKLAAVAINASPSKDEKSEGVHELSELEQKKTIDAQDILTPMGTIEKVGDADKALEFIKMHQNEFDSLDADQKERKRILRRIDWHLLPWMFILYGLCFLDKQMLSYSAIMGLYDDCHIGSTGYSWISSLYYIAYLCASYPHNRLLQKFNQVKYIAVMGICWSIVLMCMAASTSAAGLYTTRILMGVLESAVDAGFVLIISMWYKKYEQATRTGVFCSSIGFFSMIGSIIAYGAYMGGKNRPTGVHSWRIMVVCVGASTFIFSICLFFFMPKSPMEAKFLNVKEKLVAIDRLRENQQGVGSKVFKMSQFWETMRDWRTWLYVALIFTSQIPGGGTSSFAAQLIDSYGWKTEISLLLTSLPDGFIETFANTLFGRIADFTGLRSMTCMLAQIACLICVSVQIGLQQKNYYYHKYVQLIAYYFMNGFIDVAYTLVVSFVSTNTAGYTRKLTLNAVVLISFALAYFVGPHVFNDGPYYHKAKTVCLVLWCVNICLFGLQWYLNKRENKRRDKLQAEGKIPDYGENAEFMDLTDLQNLKFRYVV